VIQPAPFLTDPPVWQTDRQTELRWLRRAIAVPAVARKNVPSSRVTGVPIFQFRSKITVTLGVFRMMRIAAQYGDTGLAYFSGVYILSCVQLGWSVPPVVVYLFACVGEQLTVSLCLCVCAFLSAFVSAVSQWNILLLGRHLLVGEVTVYWLLLSQFSCCSIPSLTTDSHTVPQSFSPSHTSFCSVERSTLFFFISVRPRGYSKNVTNS